MSTQSDGTDLGSASTLRIRLLATFQILGGLLSWTLSAAAAVLLGGDDKAWPAIGVLAALGLGLLVLWSLARRRPGFLTGLAVAALALAVQAAVATGTVARRTAGDPHEGWWYPIALPVLALPLWLLIVLAAVAERRLRSRCGEPRRLGWRNLGLLGVPAGLALLVLVGSLVLPDILIRINSTVTSADRATSGQPTGAASILDGSQRWSLELTGNGAAIATTAGLAVAVDRGSGSAGVAVLDPASGATLWSQQLRGTDRAAELFAVHGATTILVDHDPRDLIDGVEVGPFLLTAADGRFAGRWPATNEDDAIDPPVGFDHVARGTNAVIGYDETGRRRWTYRPERCADPRSASSTPTIVLVVARTCSQPRGEELLGLDPRDGTIRWRQPHDDETVPRQVLVGDGFQLEREDDRLQRRDLHTGAIVWSVPGCDLVAADQSTALTSCEGGRNTVVAAYSTATGEGLWRSEVSGAVTALAPDGDDGGLALTTGTGDGDDRVRCRLVGLGGRAGTRFDLPGLADPRARCHDGPRLLQVDGSWVLGIALVGEGVGSRQRRYLGLA